MICLLLVSVVTLCAQDELDSKLTKLKQYIAGRQGMVFEMYKGTLTQNFKQHNWELERDRNYHVWIVADVSLEDIQAQAEVYREAILQPSMVEVESFPCYRWRILTFASSSRRVAVQLKLANTGGAGQNHYVVVLASSGRDESPFVPVTQMSDAQGFCYQLIGNIVYRNGMKHYENKRYQILSIMVAPNGNLFMLTNEWATLSNNGIIYKGSASRPEQKILKIVCDFDNRVFMLRADNVVLNQGGSTVYRRTDDETAVDLIEERWSVWIIARNGRRVKP
jgi:hypothetical protein